MNKYFIVKIKLQNLDKRIDKQEYRDLRKELYTIGFRDTFFDSYNSHLELLEGVYSILSFDYSGNKILTVVEEVLEKVLKEYYPANWTNKYAIIVSGPSPVYSKNLIPAKE